MLTRPSNPVLSVSEIYRLIQTSKSLISDNTNESNNLLEAYDKKDLNGIIRSILNGENINTNTRSFSHRCPLLLKAALEGESNIVTALMLLGADLKHAIVWATHDYMRDPRFDSAIQLLFDSAASGYEWYGNSTDPDHGLIAIIKKIAQGGVVNLNQLNFIGLPHGGQPLTREMLCENGIPMEGGIFTLSDVTKMADPYRRQALLDTIECAFEKYGRLIVNDCPNLVSLQAAAEAGDSLAVAARMKAGWHLQDNRNNEDEGNSIYTNFENAIKGALKTDSPDIADALIADFMSDDVEVEFYTSGTMAEHKRFVLKDSLFEAEHLACVGYKPNMVQFLRDYFAREKMDELTGNESKYYTTRLHYAAMRGDLELTVQLSESHREMIHATGLSLRGKLSRLKPLVLSTQNTAGNYFDRTVLFNYLLESQASQFEQYTLFDLYSAIKAALNELNTMAVYKLLDYRQKLSYSASDNDELIGDLLPTLITSKIGIEDKVKLFEPLTNFNPLEKSSLADAFGKVIDNDYNQWYYHGKSLSDEEKLYRLSQIIPLVECAIAQGEPVGNMQDILNRYLISLMPDSEENKGNYRQTVETIQKTFFNPQNLLETAFCNRNIEGMSIALSLGADINHPGSAFLFRLVQANADLSLVKFVFDHGINPEMTDGKGRTALAVAKDIKKTSVTKKVAELERFGDRGATEGDAEYPQFGKPYTSLNYDIQHAKKMIDYLQWCIHDRQFNMHLDQLYRLKENNDLESAQPIIELFCKDSYSHILLRRFVRDLIKEGDLNWFSAFVMHGFDLKNNVDFKPFYIPTDVRPPLPFNTFGNSDARFSEDYQASKFYGNSISFKGLINNIKDETLKQQFIDAISHQETLSMSASFSST